MVRYAGYATLGVFGMVAGALLFGRVWSALGLKHGAGLLEALAVALLLVVPAASLLALLVRRERRPAP